jgi:hypothetical protein
VDGHPAASSPFDLGHDAWHQAVADLNGDGKADVVAAARQAQAAPSAPTATPMTDAPATVTMKP